MAVDLFDDEKDNEMNQSTSDMASSADTGFVEENVSESDDNVS
ncbi:unnamed protein product [Trichobilharzia regenti]|nr:unnamed protein product [Trichobilharzia regenti]